MSDLGGDMAAAIAAQLDLGDEIDDDPVPTSHGRVAAGPDPNPNPPVPSGTGTEPTPGLGARPQGGTVDPVVQLQDSLTELAQTQIRPLLDQLSEARKRQAKAQEDKEKARRDAQQTFRELADVLQADTPVTTGATAPLPATAPVNPASSSGNSVGELKLNFAKSRASNMLKKGRAPGEIVAALMRWPFKLNEEQAREVARQANHELGGG